MLWKYEREEPATVFDCMVCVHKPGAVGTAPTTHLIAYSALQRLCLGEVGWKRIAATS